MRRLLVERELTPAGPRRRPGIAATCRSVTVNLAESPLGWLHAHGHIDDRLFCAGERLRGDYERAQIAPGVTMRWEPVRLRGILWRVVCACETVPAAEKGLGWPARSGKLVLRIALDRVADFYRIG